MSKKNGNMKLPKLTSNANGSKSKRDKAPATLSSSNRRSISLLEKVLARFDKMESVLVEHNQRISLLTEKVGYLYNLEKHIINENRSAVQRYGDALTYLDVLRLVAANKIEVNGTGNIKDLFVKSLFGQVYDSLARQVLAQEANANCSSSDRETIEVVRSALDTSNRIICRDFNSAHGFDDDLIRLPKTTLYRSSSNSEVTRTDAGRQYEDDKQVKTKSSLDSEDNCHNNPSSESDDQQFESCSSNENSEDDESSESDSTIVAAVNGSSIPAKHPCPKNTAHSTSPQSNHDNDDLSSSSFMISPTLDFTNNRSARRECKINPIELSSMTFNAPNTSRTQSIASGFTGPFFHSTPHPNLLTRGDQLVDQIMTQRKLENEQRKSRRVSTSTLPASPVRAGSSQSRPGVIPLKLTEMNGHDLSSGTFKNDSDDDSLSNTTIVQRKASATSIQKQSYVLDDSKFPNDQSTIMNSSASNRTLRPRRANISYKDLHNGTAVFNTSSRSRRKK